jgi:hypothetical protein
MIGINPRIFCIAISIWDNCTIRDIQEIEGKRKGEIAFPLVKREHFGRI